MTCECQNFLYELAKGPVVFIVILKERLIEPGYRHEPGANKVRRQFLMEIGDNDES